MSQEEETPSAPAPNAPNPPIFQRKKTAAEILREKIPKEVRMRNKEMMYERLVDQHLKNLPGNRKPEPTRNDMSTSPTFPRSRPGTGDATGLNRHQVLPPLLHLDRYRHDNDPKVIRGHNRRQLLERGISVNPQHKEPDFEAHKTVSTTSSKLSRRFLQDSDTASLTASDFYSMQSRPSTSDSLYSSSSDPSDDKDRFTSKLYRETVNPQDIIDYMKTRGESDFIYVVFAYPPNHVKYDPFNLKAVPFGQITNFNYDPEDETALYDHSMDYFTVFKEGVVRLKTNQMSPENVRKIAAAANQSVAAKRHASLAALVNPGDQSFEYLNLTRWLEEFRNHRKLMKMKSFAKFRIWKAFYTWRTNVRQNKIAKIKQTLSEDLYILNPSLRPALLNVRLLCHKISSQTLCKIEENQTYR